MSCVVNSTVVWITLLETLTTAARQIRLWPWLIWPRFVLYKTFLHYRYIPLRHIEEGNLVFELERLGEPVAGCEVLGQDPGSPGQEAGPGPEGAAGEDEVVTQGQQRQVHTRRHGGAQPGRA